MKKKDKKLEILCIDLIEVVTNILLCSNNKNKTIKYLTTGINRAIEKYIEEKHND